MDREVSLTAGRAACRCAAPWVTAPTPGGEGRGGSDLPREKRQRGELLLCREVCVCTHTSGFQGRRGKALELIRLCVWREPGSTSAQGPVPRQLLSTVPASEGRGCLTARRPASTGAEMPARGKGRLSPFVL